MPERVPAPIPPWPGEFMFLGRGDVFVRSAPAVTETGEPTEPALCVHGFGGSSTNWTDLMDLLRRAGAPPRYQPGGATPQDPPRYQPGGATLRAPQDPPGRLREVMPGALACEAVDLPGFGFSPPPPDGDYSVRAQAAAVVRLIEQRGRGPVHLIGNSLGGAVCVRAAAARPDLVRTLTLLAPAMPDLRVRVISARFCVLCVPAVGGWLLGRVGQLPAPVRVSNTLAEVFCDIDLVHPQRRAEEVAELARRDRLRYAGEALLASARAIVAEYLRRGPRSLWRVAAGVAVPTLVIYGSHDRVVDPRMAGRAARTFRRARVVLLPRTGHVPQMERPGLVAAEIWSLVAAAAAEPGEQKAAGQPLYTERERDGGTAAAAVQPS